LRIALFIKRTIEALDKLMGRCSSTLFSENILKIHFRVYVSALVLPLDSRTLIIIDGNAARQALVGLISKYFPKMHAGHEHRPITNEELEHTSVVAIKITEGSGQHSPKTY
jgi:hypothetical protein